MFRRLVPALVLVVLTAGSASAQSNVPDSAFWAGFQWRNIGPANTEGRVTDIEGVPGTATFYVATVAGGIWKTINNGTTFRPLFQHEDVVSMGDIAIAPSNPDIVWAGTGEEDSRNSISPGGGIYKSTDGGLTWQFMGLKETQAIGRIVIDPTNPDIVYVAALGHIWDANEERGLYKTTDGGRTWRNVKFISDKAGFVDVAMDPQNHNVLFASSWQRVRGPYFLNSGGPGSGLWKTTDAGETWTEVKGGGFPSTMKGRIGLAIAYSNPQIIYALVEAKKGDVSKLSDDAKPTSGLMGSGLYRSDDGGNTWRFMNDKDTRPFYYSQVRVNPADPDEVIWSSTPVQLSRDGGKTVGTTTQGIHVDQHAMWWDTKDPEHFIVGDDGGISVTWDRGGTFDFINTIPVSQFYEISYDMAVPYNVCGGLQDNGSWCGPSRRARGSIDNHMWYTVSGGDGFVTQQDPTDPNTVYAESQGGNMSRVDPATGESHRLEKPDWKDAARPFADTIAMLQEQYKNKPPRAARRHIQALQKKIDADSAALDLRYNWDTPFILSPHNPNVMYVGANRVLKSTMKGDSLKPISPDLTYADTMKIRVSTKTTGGVTPDVTGAETYATIVALAESPVKQGLLYVGTDDGRVWTSPDDGGHWNELTSHFQGVPAGTWVRRIEPSHFDANRFYVVFDGHRTNDFTPYAYVTDDGGQTFRSIAAGLPTGGVNFVHVIREDPVNQNLLFLGTDVGLYVSLDRGEHWRTFMEGFPTVPVHDLRIHPRDHELIAGTHGRSIWIVDIAPLEQLGNVTLADAPVLFAPSPGLEYSDRMVGGESTGHRWFEGQSAQYGADFTYWVPEGAAAATQAQNGPRGDMTPEQRQAMRERFANMTPEQRRAAMRQRQGGQAAAQDGAGPQQRSRGPQASIVVLDAKGDTVQTLNGPATAGLHRVNWNFRPKQAPQPLSPSERADSLKNVKLMREIADSLVQAGTMDRQMADRVLNMMMSGDRSALSRMFGGRGGAGRPGEWVARPGESYPQPGAQARQENPMRDVMQEIFRAARERGMGYSMLRGRRGGGAEAVDAGEYTVVLKIGDKEYRQPLQVIRDPSFTGQSGFGFDEEMEDWF